MGNRFGKDEKKTMLVSLLEENILKNDELLLLHADIVKEPRLSKARSWFKDKLMIFPSTRSSSIFDTQYSDLKFKQFSKRLVQGFDVGIHDVELHEDDLDKFVSATGMPLDKMFEGH